MRVADIEVAAGLSDEELLRRVEALATRAREATAELVAHLAELDKRKLYLPLGYASLFTYCTGALKFGEYAAYNRIEAARLSRHFPVVLDLLAEGCVNLSTLRLLGPHLTRANHAAVLEEANGRSKREVEELVARLSPKADAPVIIRKLPMPAAVGGAGVTVPAEQTPGLAPSGAASPGWNTMAAPVPPEPPPPPRPTVTPLAPERYRLQFTVGRETQEKLRRAQELLRREIPDGDPGAIFDRALTLLLEDIARKKLAAAAKPGRERGTAPGSRHIPRKVRRAVWARDGGRCAFVARGGRRCTERSFLEFHHVEAWARGGEPTVDNISLRCRAHNVYEAELIFGPYVPGVVQEHRAAYGVDGRHVWPVSLSRTHSTRPGAS